MTSKKLLKEFGIKKEYEGFNFPNDLEVFELYLAYLREFRVIPKKLPVETVLKIFNTLATDYVEKHISYRNLCFYVQDLYFAFGAADEIDDLLAPEVEHLMSDMADFQGSRDDLVLYVKNPLKYRELYFKRIKRWQKKNK